MTVEEAKDVLLNYTCCCKYGTSPINCSDEECDFGKAIKTLCNSSQGEWILKEKDYDGDGNNLYECTNCHHSDTHSSSVEVPFCWYCGADMREGGAE